MTSGALGSSEPHDSSQAGVLHRGRPRPLWAPCARPLLLLLPCGGGTLSWLRPWCTCPSPFEPAVLQMLHLVSPQNAFQKVMGRESRKHKVARQSRPWQRLGVWEAEGRREGAARKAPAGMEWTEPGRTAQA